MKTIKEIIILLVLLLLICNSYSQSFTFKKVFTGFAIDPMLYRFSCKPFNNDKSFILVAGELIKLNSEGSIMLTTNFKGIGGTLQDFIIKDSFIYLFDNRAYTKILTQFDTSFNFIYT
jgi:hypothetical protein